MNWSGIPEKLPIKPEFKKNWDDASPNQKKIENQISFFYKDRRGKRSDSHRVRYTHDS